MKNTIYAVSALFLMLTSCELLSPGEIINPNVSEDTYLSRPDAMKSWVNGAERTFSMAIGSYCELTEILSDNYFNNFSRSSKVFDFPKIIYQDEDVAKLQRHIGALRESAIYGLEKVAPADKDTKNSDIFILTYIKAYSYLLAGEYFLALPDEVGGDAITWDEHLRRADAVLDEAANLAENQEDLAFVYTLKARAMYRLGDKDKAMEYATKALEHSGNFVKQVRFDGINGVINNLQEAIWDTWFQPLPRLDFLDPKYFRMEATEERSINIAKAEENYLILAEAELASGNNGKAAGYLKDLLALVKSRPVQTGINDQLEGRYNGGYKRYPNSSEYRVAASPEEEFREGLVLDRQAPNLISIPYISGTSVTDEMISGASGDTEDMLALIYLMRQEIFFAEGRRVADLGIRFPICEIEAAGNESAQPYINAQIPEFIPLDQEMDAFVMDEQEKTVIINYNMNRVIARNRDSEYIVPFF